MTVRRLTEQELEALRTDMQEASMSMKTKLAKRRESATDTTAKIGDGRENGQNRTLSMRPVRLRP